MLQAVDAGTVEGWQELYESIAQELDMKVPAASLAAHAAQVTEYEARAARATAGPSNVADTHVLCVASEQWSECDFNLDVSILEQNYPDRVLVERKITSRGLRQLLTGRRFDIIHLVIAVHPDTGQLIFNRIDAKTFNPLEREDTMTPEAFASLLSESHTRLVVLATCNPLLLAVEVARTTNMIGTNVEVSGRAAAEWAECFYELLSEGYALFRAFDLTKLNSRTPMRLVRDSDVIFSSGRSR